MKKLERKNYPLDKIKSKLNMKRTEGKNYMLHKIKQVILPDHWVITCELETEDIPNGVRFLDGTRTVIVGDLKWIHNKIQQSKDNTKHVNSFFVINGFPYTTPHATVIQKALPIVAENSEIDFSQLSLEDQRTIGKFNISHMAYNAAFDSIGIQHTDIELYEYVNAYTKGFTKALEALDFHVESGTWKIEGEWNKHYFVIKRLL